MPHMDMSRYCPGTLAFMASMNTGTDELSTGVTADALSNTELDKIEGEA